LRYLSSVLCQLATLEEEVATIEATIVQLGKALPGLTQVLQLPGLNVLSGIGLLAEIGERELTPMRRLEIEIQCRLIFEIFIDRDIERE